MEIEENIQWHPAFCSAMELELRENKKDLEYEREHNLSRMPLKIDFLVIKKKPNTLIKNEIGDFFLGNNIFEYKSPGDSMNAGTFYKALAYACLNKDETENTNEILKTDTTVTFVREQKLEKLLRQLAEKYELTKRAEGIYRISGMLFLVQFLVTGEMDREGHVFLSSLTRTMSREQVHRLLGRISMFEDNEDRKNADSIVNVASEANIKLFKEMIQEGDQMCEELKEMLAPEIVEFKILLAEQNAKLADKDAKLADKDAKLADKDIKLAEQKAKLADKDAKLADKDIKLAEQNTKLADKNAEIIKLKKMLADAGIKA